MKQNRETIWKESHKAEIANSYPFISQIIT